MKLRSVLPVLLGLAACGDNSHVDVGPQPGVAEVSTTTNEDGSVTVTIPMNGEDADSMTFTVTRPQHGAVTGTGPVFVYHPAINFAGSDSFRVTISDGEKSVIVPVFIQIGAVNDPPVAIDDEFTTLEDTTLAFPTSALLANDYDVDSPHLTVTAVTQPDPTLCGAHFGCGQPVVTLADNTVTIHPRHNFNGSFQFHYTVSDGQLTATGTVTIDVTAVNDAPVANNDSEQGSEDTALVIPMSDLLANDFDVDGQTPTVQSVGEATHGSVAIDGTTVVYTPDADYNGDDGFTYTITDGSLTSSAFVSLSILAVDDAPIAEGNSATSENGAPVDVTVSATDVDSTDLTFAVESQPAHGSVTNVGATFTYTPTEGYSGDDSFTFTASDGTLSSAPATVSVTVTAVDAPPVPDQPFQDVFLPFGGCGEQEDFTYDLTVTATDPDSTTLTYSILEFFPEGELASSIEQIGPQTFRYHRGSGDGCFFGEDFFEWQVTDEQGQSGFGEVVFFSDF